MQQLDALTYRNPSTIPAEQVIVVGDGATGRQIALELARTRRVTLAGGRWRLFGPQRVLGRDTTAWGLRLGLITADKASAVGRLVHSVDPTPGLYLRSSALRRVGIEIVSRCVGAEGDRLRFADGRLRPCGAVIWATGCCDDTGWLDVEGASTPERFLHDHGVAPVSGLYHVGREWQSSRASGLICGVYRDASAIAAHVKQHLGRVASTLP